jgi:hypothetical protein
MVEDVQGVRARRLDPPRPAGRAMRDQHPEPPTASPPHQEDVEIVRMPFGEIDDRPRYCAANASHPFYPLVRDGRERFRHRGRVP